MIQTVNATVVPNTTQCCDNNLGNVFSQTAQAMQESLNGFSSRVPESNETQEKKNREAQNILQNFMSYIKTDAFAQDVEETAKKYGVPPKRIAQNFFEKVLGTVGDILGIAISVISNAGRMVINIASTIAHGILNIITNIANGLAGIVTLNKTCVA